MVIFYAEQWSITQERNKLKNYQLLEQSEGEAFPTFSYTILFIQTEALDCWKKWFQFPNGARGCSSLALLIAALSPISPYGIHYSGSLSVLLFIFGRILLDAYRWMEDLYSEESLVVPPTNLLVGVLEKFSWKRSYSPFSFVDDLWFVSFPKV